MTERPFRTIDVFASTSPTSGNPLAVVLGAEGLTTAQMAAFSAWTNLSECTFVLPPTGPDADYRVRIFSLSTELPFAGHPTLGTARAWLDAGGVPRTPGVVVQECGVGLVPVEVRAHVNEAGVAEELLAFAAPPLRRSGKVADDELARTLAILGIAPHEVVAASWIDNGPGWLGLLLKSAAAVTALEPDLSHRESQVAIGVAGRYPDGGEAQLEVRAFFNDAPGPLREDPVTGSLNASLAQWLLRDGLIGAPYVARQGRATGADGYAFLSEDDGQVWVGGRAVVTVRGAVTL